MATAKVRRAPRTNRTLQWFGQRTLPRAILFLTMWAGLVILVMPGRYATRIDLQAGQKAATTVYAETSFEFEDIEATRLQRELAAERVAPVFTIDLSRIDPSWQRVARTLSWLADLKQRHEGTVPAEECLELAREWEGAAVRLTEPDFVRLAEIAGDAELERRLFLILAEHMQRGVVRPETEELAPELSRRGEILVYFPETDSYEPRDPLNLDTPRSSVPTLRRQVEGALAKKGVSTDPAEPMARLLAGSIDPNLRFDGKRTEERRRQREMAVESVIRDFAPGEVLIERGHIVTPADLDLLKAHQERLDEEQSPGDMIREASRVAAMTAVILLVGFALLLAGQPALRRSNSRLLLIALLLLGNAALWRATWWLTSPGLSLIPDRAVPFTAPLAVGPMLGTILLGPAVGMYLAVISALTVGAATGPTLLVVFTAFVTSAAGVYGVRNVRMRSQLVRAGVGVGATAVICTMIFDLLLAQPNLGTWLHHALLAFFSGIVGAFIVGSILPAFEFLFGIPTDISLLELSDTNHPLLRRMQEEAPGTYHHSLMVANLAEAAAEAIGANPLLARVCALYHDIGKLVKPVYFTENIPDQQNNPHDGLAEGLSRVVIQAHVKEGIDLAMKHRLNQPIMDVIRQHHGTTLVKYFYQRARQREAAEKEKNGTRTGNGAKSPPEVVREEAYRYRGPRPTFKESAIIHLADPIEATSRSLKDPTPAKIEGVVRDSVRDRILDGQLDDAELTLRELRVVQERFVATLKNMLHSRIAYPKDDDEDRVEKRPAQDEGVEQRRSEAAPTGVS